MYNFSSIGPVTVGGWRQSGLSHFSQARERVDLWRHERIDESLGGTIDGELQRTYMYVLIKNTVFEFIIYIKHESKIVDNSNICWGDDNVLEILIYKELGVFLYLNNSDRDSGWTCKDNISKMAHTPRSRILGVITRNGSVLCMTSVQIRTTYVISLLLVYYYYYYNVCSK